MLNKVISNVSSLILGNNLKGLCVRGSMALGAGTVTAQSIRFIRNMILARVLAPHEFGLMAIVWVVMVALEAFTEVGIKQSVIQNKHGAENDYLNVAWWAQVVRGLGLFLIAVISAPFISSFYDKPELLGLLRVSFIAILFRNFVSPRAYVLEKEYQFSRAVFLTQGSAIAGAITTISLAFIIRNVWALVIGYVAEAAVLCLASYLLVPFMPGFKVNREYLGELMKFGRRMFGLPILTMAALQADVLVLGKLVPNEQVGMYYLALTLVAFPIELFSCVISPVLLPAFAQKQDDKTGLSRNVIKITKWTALFGIPVVVFMACCAGGIILLIYGERYIAAAIPFGILSIQILNRSEGAVLATTYLAVGRPHLHRLLVALRLVIIAVLIYPAIIYLGLAGAAVVVVLSNFVAQVVQVFWCRRIIDLKFGDYIRSYIPGVLLALPVLTTAGLLRIFGIRSPVLVLIVCAAVLIASYAGYLAKFAISKFQPVPFTGKKGTAGTLDFAASIETEDV
ncbi:MAG: lipopolysaccharide biosynthesis protein [Sedimentisphaerales bacterium]|jgi:PST family polysaccharide transporter